MAILLGRQPISPSTEALREYYRGRKSGNEPSVFAQDPKKQTAFSEFKRISEESQGKRQKRPKDRRPVLSLINKYGGPLVLNYLQKEKELLEEGNPQKLNQFVKQYGKEFIRDVRSARGLGDDVEDFQGTYDYMQGNEAEFIDRIRNPENYPFIRNKDGSVSTHLMANSSVEIEGKETPIAFPMIQMMPNGELYKFKNGDSALKAALRLGNYKSFKTNKEAEDYAKGGYKTKKFNEFGKKMSRRQ